ncbi:MAG: 16S rRNA (cytosine(1402)-N(4))-methyltransferase RsmH [Bacteroidetes bacterium]|nr:16S rRNA (cytosine(1402)-N(4))-methyltransferase RsmH [Bacteroidota bacterium]
MSGYHTPVMLRESVAALAIKPNGIYVDATFGGGGHARAILEQLRNGRLYAFDRDGDALSQTLPDKRLVFIHNNFKYLQNCLRYLGCNAVDGILADLGVSSHQFDTKQRGFSFRFQAPLDMRMNQQASLSATQVLNHYSEQELERIFRQYGEMPQSKRVAALVVKAREEAPVKDTQSLRSALAPLIPTQQIHKFLATLYQAIRIEVNGEIPALEALLAQSLRVLNNGGRLVIISYHSLEDRMVKNFMRSGNTSGIVSKDFYGSAQTPFTAVTKKAITPSPEEKAQNNRARSAKLRAVEKRNTEYL